MISEYSDSILLVEDVAQVLKCSESHVRTLIRSGEIKAHLVGRTYRIPRENLESYINTKIVTELKNQ